jgi:uncharacterized membrane protein
MDVGSKVAGVEADRTPLFSTNVDGVSSYISAFVYFIVLKQGDKFAIIVLNLNKLQSGCEVNR